MRIATILGTRPQFIKAAMVSKEIEKNECINELIIHTGQHFDKNMSQIFFEEMGIPKPDFNLNIHSLTHGAMTGRQIEKIEQILIIEKPDWILVYGDTNSTLAGALAATKLDIPVAHVEAGLRSFNRNMPEEINRILTDQISELLFCPTETGVINLNNEGITRGVYNVGDVMYDAILHYTGIAEKKSKIIETLNLNHKKYVLCTIHRQENTDDSKRLKNIFSALSQSPMPVIIPLHPNTKNKLVGSDIELNNRIKLIEPIGYLDMIMLQKNAKIIATDSGGMQKEAYFHQVPCITLRDETEWVETVSNGSNILTGANEKKIVKSLNTTYRTKFIDDEILPYGKGKAVEKIIKKLLDIK